MREGYSTHEFYANEEEFLKVHDFKKYVIKTKHRSNKDESDSVLQTARLNKALKEKCI